MKINEITEGLDRDNHPGDGFFVIEGLTEKLFKGLIGALAELAQELSVKSEMGPEHLGNSKDILPVGQGIEYLLGDPFPKHEDPFLMAGGAEVTTLAGKGEKDLMMAAFALDAGKALF